MKRLSAHLAIPLVAALALGCQERPQGFMPLETGRTSVYDVEYSNVVGRVQNAEAVVRIEGKRKIGEHEYFRVVVVIKGIPGHEPDVYYQRFAADGLHELRYVGDRPVDYLQTPWPLEIGRAWLVNAAGLEMTCRVDARGPAILPEKTYDDAYKISCYGARTGSRFKNETYLVEGVGPVRTVQELGDLTVEMRLREAG
jgi:hypothetical protein